VMLKATEFGFVETIEVASWQTSMENRVPANASRCEAGVVCVAKLDSNVGRAGRQEPAVPRGLQGASFRDGASN